MPQPEQVWVPWLADAPLFIDGLQLGSLYDSVLRPDTQVVSLEYLEKRTESLQTRLGGEIGAKLPIWFPWLQAGVTLRADSDRRQEDQGAQMVRLEPVDRPERKLVEMALHYAERIPDRIWFPAGETWQLPSPVAISEAPRLLAFLDFPGGTKFMPMAAELADGKVVTFFDALVEKFKKDGDSLPVRYPDDPGHEKFAENQAKYWQWFSSHWSANGAIQVIENKIGRGGRPRWIDYRVPVNGGPNTIHLHVVGRGKFDTGVFAYNLVKRGWKHGLRIVGTVKSEPDINVLAIYEK